VNINLKSKFGASFTSRKAHNCCQVTDSIHVSKALLKRFAITHVTFHRFISWVSKKRQQWVHPEIRLVKTPNGVATVQQQLR
jgi:hypothetical protein